MDESFICVWCVVAKQIGQGLVALGVVDPLFTSGHVGLKRGAAYVCGKVREFRWQAAPGPQNRNVWVLESCQPPEDQELGKRQPLPGFQGTALLFDEPPESAP